LIESFQMLRARWSRLTIVGASNPRGVQTKIH
jgi:hypothetical protein